jgi:hypothetical protein
MEQSPSTGRDLWLLKANGQRAAFANSPADESAARFAPDGRDIAYVSNESGRAEVYVRGVADAAPARRVSPNGGMEPVWQRDGGALYYRVSGRLMKVPMSGGAPRGTPQLVFDGGTEPGTFDAAGYDVLPGANRLLMITSASAGNTLSELKVILNWSPSVPAQ